MPEQTHLSETYDEQETIYALDEGSHLKAFTQMYSRRIAGVLLAGSTMFGVSACDPGDQTIEIGRALPEKVLSKNGSSIVTGLCAEQKYGNQIGHNCTPQDDQLKEQTVQQVRDASGGNTRSYRGINKSESCDNPGSSFVAGLNPGDVISKQEKNYRKFGEKGEIIEERDYCTWSKH
jgi:hypothetical protein